MHPGQGKVLVAEDRGVHDYGVREPPGETGKIPESNGW